MPVKVELEAEEFSTLSDSQKELYRENEEGKFVLDIEGVNDAGNLLSAYEKTKSRAKELESIQKEKEKELAQLKKQLDEKERLAATAKQNLAVTEGKYKEAYEETRKQLEDLERKAQEDHASLERKYKSVLLDQKIKEMSLKNGVDQERLTDFFDVVKNRFELDEDTGEIIFKDKHGVRYGKSETEHFLILQKEKDWAFKSGRKAGGADPKEAGTVTRKNTPVFNIAENKTFVATKENVEALLNGRLTIK